MGQPVSSTDYFDSSALVKRYMAELGSAWVQARYNDPSRTIATVELSRVEIAALLPANCGADSSLRLNIKKSALNWQLMHRSDTSCSL